jgi:hypothetical protein
MDTPLVTSFPIEFYWPTWIDRETKTILKEEEIASVPVAEHGRPI